MAERISRDTQSIVELAETARGTFDFLLTLADELLEVDPSLSVRCLYQANKLADVANKSLRDERQGLSGGSHGLGSNLHYLSPSVEAPAPGT